MGIPTLPILLVNRNVRNLQLLCEHLDKEGYKTLTASNYDEFDLVLAQQVNIAGALIDITGFDAQIWPRCEQLRSRKAPFLMISPKLSAAIQQASLSHGARAVMLKPLVVKEFIGIIQSMLDE
ncbi:MAG TPA: response regulator [Ktedonobacteraceae bacterium]